MALIQQAEITRFRHIITPVLPKLIEIAIDNPGKGRTMDPAVVEQWLLGWMLALSTHGHCTYPAVREILLDDIDRQVAWDNGMFKRTPNGQRLVLSKDAYYTVVDKVDNRLGWTLDRHPNLTIAERLERRTTLYEIVDTIIDSSIFYQNKSGLFSVDESGIWAWLRGKFSQAKSRPKSRSKNKKRKAHNKSRSNSTELTAKEEQQAEEEAKHKSLPVRTLDDINADLKMFDETEDHPHSNKEPK